jgi:hypothetical protein
MLLVLVGQIQQRPMEIRSTARLPQTLGVFDIWR